MRRGKSRPSSRQSILGSARKLFTERGYEATSVDAILLDCGLSKGTFYHYFKSKSELLDGVVEEVLREGLSTTAGILDDTRLNAAEKLDRFLAAGRRWRLANVQTVAELARVVLDDDNALLREKLRRRSADLVLPVVARIIEQGSADGSFSTPHSDAHETAALVLHLADSVGDANYRELLSAGETTAKVERVKKRADACFTAIERIIGAKPGTLSRLDDSFLAAVSRALDSAS